MTENDSGTVELTRRKALGSMAILGAAGAGAGAGSWAWFSDSEESNSNTISTGTVDLTVNDENGFGYNLTGIAPGEDMGSYSFPLANNGTIDAAELVVQTSSSGNSNLLAYIDLTLTYDGDSVTNIDTLQDLADSELILDGIDADTSKTLSIDATFSEDAGNGLQGASVDVDHTFILRQESGEDG